MNDLYNKMLEECKIQAKNSYSIYSGYRVAAALLCKDGTIIGGCNIENASFGLTNCAERTAIFRAIATGYKPGDFESIMIYTDRLDSIPYPCGACRQVMNEIMGRDKLVIVINDNLKPLEYTVAELLPGNFDKDSL